MTIVINKKAKTQWEKSCISYSNYQRYIENKGTGDARFSLTLIDLLHISNFKGGNATINEMESEINLKLEHYSAMLKQIDAAFGILKLADLTKSDLEKLTVLVLDTCKLAIKGSMTKIDGFSTSYLSALLNAYFPELIPILDRRVLINLGLVDRHHRDSQDQIKKIADFYQPLIFKTAKISKSLNSNIRQIDKEYFIRHIENESKV